MKYLLSLFSFLVVTAACSAQKFKPALHLVKGDTYYLVSTGASAIAQSVNGSQNKVNLTLSYKMAFKVTGGTDTTYDMEVSYQALQMKINMADTSIEMDSKKASPLDIPSSIIAAMMTRPFNIKLSRTGKIRSVENLEKMINGVFDGFPQIDSMKKKQFRSQFMQSFGPNAFKGTLEMGTAIFPSDEVTKNDKWTVNTSTAEPVKSTIETVYQLVGIDNGFYQIHGDGIVTSDKNSKPVEVNWLPMRYDLNGSTLTDIKVNRTTGWVSQVSMKQLMSGNLIIQDNPKVPGGMTVPMTFNTEITTTDK
jgi:hypothetical protein